MVSVLVYHIAILQNIFLLILVYQVSCSCFDIGCPLNPCVNPELNYRNGIQLIFKSARYMHLTCSALVVMQSAVCRKRTYSIANLPAIYRAIFPL